MFETPQVPQITGAGLPDLAGSLAVFPLKLEITPFVLLVLAMLVGILVAAITVMLVYHWRRFPFEHDVFRVSERVYLLGVAVFAAVAVVGMLFS